MKFTIPVVYQNWGTVEVEAKNQRDLVKKLKSKEFIDQMPLPDEPSYIDESYKIDTENINGRASKTDDGNQGPEINLTEKELQEIENPK